MKFYLKKINVLLLTIVLGTLNTLAQNYFYTSLKVPFIEYIDAAINEGSQNATTDGIFLKAGYAISVMPDFYIETGIEYLFVNRFNKKYYSDKGLTQVNADLQINNSAFAVQLKPLYNITSV